MFIVLLESKIIYPLALERQQRQRSSNHILWLGCSWIVPFPPAWTACSKHMRPPFCSRPGAYAPVAWLAADIVFHRLSRFILELNYFPRIIGFRYSFEIPSYIRKPKIKRTFHMRLKWWLFGYSEHRNRLWIFSIRCLAEETSSTKFIHPHQVDHRDGFRWIHWPAPWFRVSLSKRVSDGVKPSNLSSLVVKYPMPIHQIEINECDKGIWIFCHCAELKDKPPENEMGGRYTSIWKPAKPAMEGTLNPREHSLSFC